MNPDVGPLQGQLSTSLDGEVPLVGSKTVFISYASQERNEADAIYQSLAQAGVTSWLAPREILPGADFAEEIVHAVASCELLLLLYSRNSNRSPHVVRELHQAVNHGKRVLSVRLDSTTPTATMSYLLGTYQWHEAPNHLEDHLAVIVARVQELLEAEDNVPESTSSTKIVRAACQRLLAATEPFSYVELDSEGSAEDAADGQLTQPLGERTLADEILYALNQSGWVLLVGPGGAGKTRTLLHLREQLASQLLDLQNQQQPPEEPSVSPRITGLPVYVDLTRYDASQEPLEATEHLVMETVRRLSTTGESQQARQLLLELDTAYSLVILADGLNQLDSSRRDAVLRGLMSFKRTYPATKLVVATRRGAAVAPEEFTEIAIAPPNDDIVQELLLGFGATHKHAEQILAQLQEQPLSIREYIRNPFFLKAAAKANNDVTPRDRTLGLSPLLKAFVDAEMRKVTFDTNTTTRLHECLWTLGETIKRPGDITSRASAVGAIGIRCELERTAAEELVDYLVTADLISDNDEGLRFAHQILHEFSIADANVARCQDSDGFVSVAEGTMGYHEANRLFDLYKSEGEPWDMVFRLFVERVDESSLRQLVSGCSVRRPELAALLAKSRPSASLNLSKLYEAAENTIRRSQARSGSMMQGFVKLNVFLLVGIFLTIDWFSDDLWGFNVFFIMVALVGAGIWRACVQLRARHARETSLPHLLEALRLLDSAQANDIMRNAVRSVMRGHFRNRPARAMVMEASARMGAFDEERACRELKDSADRIWRATQLAHRGSQLCLESLIGALRGAIMAAGFQLRALQALLKIEERHPEVQQRLAEPLRYLVDYGASSSVRHQAMNELKKREYASSWEQTRLRFNSMFRGLSLLVHIVIMIALVCIVRYLLLGSIDSLIAIVGAGTDTSSLSDITKRMYDGLFGLGMLMSFNRSARHYVAELPRPLNQLLVLQYAVEFLHLPVLVAVGKILPATWFGAELACPLSRFYLLRGDILGCEEAARRMKQAQGLAANRSLTYANAAWCHFIWGDERLANQWFALALEEAGSINYVRFVEDYAKLHLQVRFPPEGSQERIRVKLTLLGQELQKLSALSDAETFRKLGVLK